MGLTPVGVRHGDTSWWRVRGGSPRARVQEQKPARNQPCPLLLQLLLGTTDASLRMRKLWRFLPQLCKHPLLHKPCANLLFLLGGYNEKNLNMVGALPHAGVREPEPRGAPLGSTQQRPLVLPNPLPAACPFPAKRPVHLGDHRRSLRS